MACTETIALEHIDYCPADEIAAGTTTTEIYAAPLSEFLAIIAPPALNVATTLSEAATIVGPHTFTSPAGFIKLNILPDTGNVESPMVGEKGSKSFANSFGGTLPGTSARNLGFGRKYKNVPMIFLVKQNNGDIRQIGSETRGAYFEEFTPASGAKPEDVNGIPFKITDVQAYPAPVYTGTITEATIA